MKTNEKIIRVLKDINKKNILTPDMLTGLTLEEKDLIKALYKDKLITEALNFVQTLDTDKNWNEIKEKLIPNKTTPIIPLWRKVSKYAAILLVILASVFLLKTQLNSKIQPSSSFTNEIKLVLENGEVRVLNTNTNNQIIKKNGEIIGLQEGNVINYNSSKTSKKLVFNTLEVPYGKTFNIILSDGTKVFLNSGSKIKYPINFIIGKNREVFLEGEAFFDVAKDKNHPFIVNANNVDIKVLGTKFNVSSYAEDSEINTVLVEGSVSLSHSKSPNTTSLLQPGYKGSWNKLDAKMSFEKVDTKIYTEWMQGDVIFRNTTFEDMVKKLERNYNVSIQNNNKSLSLKKFNASFNKNIESIDQILISIGKIHPFTYKKEDNKIIINP